MLLRRFSKLPKGGVHVAVDALGVAVTCQNAIKLKKKRSFITIRLTSRDEKGMISPITL